MNHDRTPPNDVNAEMAALGGMLLQRSAIDEVTPLLKGNSFYQPKHEDIFNAITALNAAGQPVDAVTAARELDRRGILAKVGGRPYLHTLMGSIATAANAGWHAEIVREHAIRRRLIEIGTRLAQMGYATDDPADLPEIIDRAQALVMTLDHAEDVDEDLTLADPYHEVIDAVRNGTRPGLPTGFRDYDALTGGLHAGQMVVIAARPALGKSVLGENLARHAATKQNTPAAVFSLEMSRFEMAKRAISAEGAINLHHLSHGNMTEEDWRRLEERTAHIPGAPIYVDDNPNHTIATIRSKARRLRNKHGIGLLVVDYLQLMDPEEKRRGGENRQQDVAAISRGLKLLAKELMIPVIAVAQLNRGPEGRSDKKPVMSDLRDSGAIEMDADVVILIHREAAYDAESPRAGEADLIVDKNRGGQKAVLTVAFQGHYARFRDMGQG